MLLLFFGLGDLTVTTLSTVDPFALFETEGDNDDVDVDADAGCF